MKGQAFPAVAVALIIAVSVGILLLNSPNPAISGDVKKFSSYDELVEHINSASKAGDFGYFGVLASAGGIRTAIPIAAPAIAESSASNKDYSATNIQVAGVEEADVVKNDGKYIYTASGNKIIIIDAYPAGGSEIVSVIDPDGFLNEFFINGDRLVVFGQESFDGPETPLPAVGRIAPPFPPSYYAQKMFAKVYDISDRSKPVLARDFNAEGSYFDSRMVGDYVYAVFNTPVRAYEDIVVPRVNSGGIAVTPEFPDVYYFDNSFYSYAFTTIMSFNVQAGDDPETDVYMMGSASNIFVSHDNIYITYQKTFSEFDFMDRLIDEVLLTSLPSDVVQEIRQARAQESASAGKFEKIGQIIMDHYNSLPASERERFMKTVTEKTMPLQEEMFREMEKTVVHRIGIDSGMSSYGARGEVPGRVLNQFSMDEHAGAFRVATTSGQFARTFEEATSRNNVYALNMGLDIVGSLEGLAPGEQIFSARFIGDRGYLVTFKKVDPLFVIDLSDPRNPEVLGKLKIPGFSDYLHPYDENHIIGLGKEAAAAEQGDFAWYQGVKLALFDVSDVENPKEVSRYIIGDRGTDSIALHDHKAFLFSREKSLLVIPILLAEIDEEKYPGGVPDSAFGDYVWQGAYVFDLTLEDGFGLRGRITHVEDDSEFRKSGFYYYGSGDSVKRALYIRDVLYTISESLVKMNDIVNLDELNKLFLDSTKPVEPEEMEFSFRTLAKNLLNGIDDEKSSHIIKNSKEWDDLLNNFRSAPFDLDNVDIDFEEKMAIAVFMGSKPSGGFNIEITQAVENEDTITIHVTETSPGKTCMVTAVVSSPYHIIEIDRSDKDVVFEVEEFVNSCMQTAPASVKPMMPLEPAVATPSLRAIF